ncbi:MAG: hypothetical protein ACR2GT_13625 [Gaiellaceae bacterium]
MTGVPFRTGAIAVTCALFMLLVSGCGSDDAAEAPVVETPPKNATQAAVESLGVRCVELTDLSKKFTQSLEGQTGDLDDVSFLLAEMADTVPPEIEPEYTIVAGAFRRISEALEDTDFAYGTTQSPEDLQKLRELKSSLATDEVQVATRGIERWAKANCQ